MSTEHQQYSTSNQMDVIREYAKRRGLEIAKVYSDEGKSGLNIQGRDSLAQMIKDVQAGEGKHSCILVYDVSRWGRFQDADESAYYEYICRQAGVTVHYCAEQFENDGSPVSTIVKGVKRTMAGEYSRELSSKVFQGACRLIQLGFKQGGTAGFGLRRMLVDLNGQRKAELKMGEQKSLQTDRVVLAAGPEDEVKVVRWMYRAFVTEGKNESEIAAIAECAGRVLTDFGRALDERNRPSGAHERKVHREQRLSPDVVQAEAQARDQPAGEVDSCGRGFSGDSGARCLFPSAGNHPGQEPAANR